MRTNLAASMLIVAAALPLAGCDRSPLGFVDVSEVAEHPDRYDDQEIKVRGVVADNLKIPFMAVRSYTLADGDARLVVFTNGPVPAVGDEVAIRARMTSLAVVSGEAVGARLEEIERLKPLW